MVNKTRIKFIASIIEIIVLLSIFTYIIGKVLVAYKIKSVRKNWITNRQNPLLMVLGAKGSTNPFIGFLSQLTGNLFKPMKYAVSNIFNKFTFIFKYFQKVIDLIRFLTKPIRLFFKQATIMFYKKLSQFMIGITYQVHKIRQIMKRSVSGFNMAFHSLNHMSYNMQSIYNSPIIPITQKFMGSANWSMKNSKKASRSRKHMPRKLSYT